MYGVTGGTRTLPEVADISFAIKRASRAVGRLHVIVFGRGSREAESTLRTEFAGADVEVETLGLLSPDEVSRTLARADVMLFVRGQISSRRGSAIAGIACGLPVVCYAGPDTGWPITEAGILPVPLGDREALSGALEKVLSDDALAQCALPAQPPRAGAIFFLECNRGPLCGYPGRPRHSIDQWCGRGGSASPENKLAVLRELQVEFSIRQWKGRQEIALSGKNQLAERASVHLDLIRGTSALAVMFGHVRGLFFVDFPFLANKSPAYRALYAITGLGHQAVIVFFVLSGYFIGTSVTDSVGEHRWSWRVYLVNRLTRLQLVLLPALVLGAVWDRIGMRIPQAASFYYGGLYKYYFPSVACAQRSRSFSAISFFSKVSCRRSLVRTDRSGASATNSGITFCSPR